MKSYGPFDGLIKTWTLCASDTGRLDEAFSEEGHPGDRTRSSNISFESFSSHLITPLSKTEQSREEG